MDANKAEALRELGYTVKDVCSSCTHGEFRAGSLFGVCTVNTYEHLKHTDTKRHLSVVAQGWCPQYQQAENHKMQTEHFIF